MNNLAEGTSMSSDALTVAVAVMGIFVTIVIALVGGVAVWAFRVSKGESGAASAKEAHARLDKLASDFGDFKEHVAREYTSNAMIRQFEERMAQEFKNVRERLDQLFTPKV